MNTPKVSVTLCSYDGELYIKEQLDSILQQTYTNIELIIVDDCSTDSTFSILEEYSLKYDNVHVYKNEVNLGFIKNFEKACLLASGDFIAFSDQDDIWKLDKIEKQVKAIGRNMLVYSDSEYIDAEGKLLNKKVSDYRKLVDGSNLFMLDEHSGLWIAGHTMLFRRELLDIAIPVKLNHDLWFAYIAMLKGTIGVISEPLVLYRQHGANAIGGLGCHKLMNKNTKSEKSKEVVPKKNDKIESLLSVMEDSNSEFYIFLNKLKYYRDNPSFTNNLKRIALRFKYIDKIYQPLKKNYMGKLLKTFKQ